MGLSVLVFKNIQLVDDEDEADFEAFVLSDRWKYKIRNLINGGLYKGECIDRPVSYPYSMHSRFREALIKMIGRDDLLKLSGEINYETIPPEIPFYDLIDFADTEGCLDWEISEKIYNDFKSWDTIAHNYFIEKKLYRYYDLYQRWMNAFKLARDHYGVVSFH